MASTETARAALPIALRIRSLRTRVGRTRILPPVGRRPRGEAATGPDRSLHEHGLAPYQTLNPHCKLESERVFGALFHRSGLIEAGETRRARSWSWREERRRTWIRARERSPRSPNERWRGGCSTLEAAVERGMDCRFRRGCARWGARRLRDEGARSSDR